MDYKETRERFMEPLSDSIKRAYKLLFTKIDYYQVRNGIQFEEMTSAEFEMFVMKELIDKSSAAANVKVNLLGKYAKFIGKDFVKLDREDIIKLTEAKLGNKETDENQLRYVPMDELKKNIENKFVNAIDKAIILLLRMGISGTRFTELINLKSKDIDIENRRIYLEDRSIDITDDYTLNVLKEALEQQTYHLISHGGDLSNKATEYDFNMECEYLFKQRRTSRNNDGLNAYKYAGMVGRIHRLFEELDMGVSAINLLQSNAVDRLIEYENKTGVHMGFQRADKFLKSIGVKQYAYQMIHLAKYVREKYNK